MLARPSPPPYWSAPEFVLRRAVILIPILLLLPQHFRCPSGLNLVFSFYDSRITISLCLLLLVLLLVVLSILLVYLTKTWTYILLSPRDLAFAQNFPLLNRLSYNLRDDT